MTTKDHTPLLEVERLQVGFATSRGYIQAVKDFSCHLQTNETLGIVGESGSGKSVASLALMRLLPDNTKWHADKIKFSEHDLLSLCSREFQRLRGKGMAMVFQNPMTSLNPCYTVGQQLLETLAIHRPHLRSKNFQREKAIALLQQVGIPAAAERMRSFPHELSGGMAQRVMIAMALACQPKLLIADEPTTALDVTISRQILDLLDRIKQRRSMSMILISHDLMTVERYCARVVVMYAGEVVESGATAQVFSKPRHPYTQALLAALPHRHKNAVGKPLPTIEGNVPSAYDTIKGCRFHPRCQYADDQCRKERPLLANHHRAVRCHHPLHPR
ncbi:MAG: ABC transporter ATP-binding protein [Pseudomonadota bacterium]|nr:ABC transporter ATP-binding protein [Pseudomonadota bacterium]